MKDDKRNNTDELMDAWEGIRPEYLEEADQVFLHGKKGQRRRRTAVLLAAAAVFIAAVGIGMVLIIRNYTGKSDVSTDLTVRQDSSIETVPEESGTLSYEESKAAEEAEAAREAMEKAEKEREASLSEEAEKEAAYEASKAADAAKQAEEAAKQAKTEQEAFLAEAAEKEEKLNREDFTYRLPGCFRRLVIKSDGSIIVDSADSIYISPQSPSIMQESLLCTYGESVYQASASGSGGRTVWEVYDQSACTERGRCGAVSSAENLRKRGRLPALCPGSQCGLQYLRELPDGDGRRLRRTCTVPDQYYCPGVYARLQRDEAFYGRVIHWRIQNGIHL